MLKSCDYHHEYNQPFSHQPRMSDYYQTQATEIHMIQFGTLGAARITPRALIYPCMDEPRTFIRCIAARDRDRAAAFAAHHGIPEICSSYEEVVNHPKVNAVYNPLQITAHHEWSIKALQAGKHVLCEKSFASNTLEAEEMAVVAEENGLVIMDAFHYRYHPLFIRAKEIVDSGELGDLVKVDAAFHVPVPVDGGIRTTYELGGGVTMDIGCYPISWVRHITGEEPAEISATAVVGPPQVDLMLEADMVFPSGIKGHISGDMREGVGFKAELTVVGTKGQMKVSNPLVPQNGHRIEVQIGAETRVEYRDRRPTYGYQLDAFIAAVEDGQPLLTGPDDAIKQMRTIDRCYESAGLPVRGLQL